MKLRFVSYSLQTTTIKAIYPRVILREMPFGNETDTGKVQDLEGFSASRTAYDRFLSRLRSKCETIGVTISGDGGGVNISG